MLDLDALNPAPEARAVQLAEDDALAAMVGKFFLGLALLGVFFGLGVAALTGSPTDERVVYVAKAAHAAVPAAAVERKDAAADQKVRTERQAAARAPRLSEAPSPKAAADRDVSAREDVDARYRALVAASERDVAQLEEAARKGQTLVQAEDGSWVPESFYDEPAKPERKAGSSKSSSKSGGKVTAEDGSRVPSSFYDRTDYNRNGVADQCEGWPKNPNPEDVAAGRK